MKYLITVLFSIMFLGCTGQQMADNITKAEIALSGNKPPKSFKIANLYTMQNYVFNMQNYTIALPSAKEEDFTVFGGWQGMTHYDRDITLHLGNEELGYPYHIQVTFSTSKYTERERAIENKDITYFRKKMLWLKPTDHFAFTYHGKEKYPCTVAILFDQTNKKQEANYRCYKFNSKKTQAKEIIIGLSYITIPSKKLSENYMFQDLINRAQRMLDSLYIKDGWDE